MKTASVSRSVTVAVQGSDESVMVEVHMKTASVSRSVTVAVQGCDESVMVEVHMKTRHSNQSNADEPRMA